METIGIVGPGRVGKALAHILTERGYQIMAVSRLEESKIEVIPGGGRIIYTNLGELGSKADLILITTPDAVIAQVADKLAGIGLKSAGVLHCSGAISSEALSALKKRGILTGSLHPLQSFATSEQALRNLPGSLFTYEGEEGLLDQVKYLVGVLGGSLKILADSGEKTLYHAGACIVSNYLVTLGELGVKCLRETGFAEQEAREALVTLMRGTLNNLCSLTPGKALTGPISRGDTEVVARHLSILKRRLPEVERVYRALAPATADLAVGAGRLSPGEHQEMMNIFKGGK